MKFEVARDQLRHAIRNQKSISIPKLEKILKAMHVTYKCRKSEQEINYLKKENAILRKENKSLRKGVKV